MKLIKFQVQNVSVPNEWNKPYYSTLEHDGLKNPIGIADESITTMPMPMMDVKRVDYELIILRDAQNRVHRYYVNFEKASHVMPILEGIVQTKTKELEKKNMESEFRLARVAAELKYYKNLWFVKLYERVKNFLKHYDHPTPA